MKKINYLARLMIFSLMPILFSLSTTSAEGQILKKIGKKVEKSVQQRVDKKIDKGIDKGLDKVEDGVDETVKDATTAKPKEEKSSAKAQQNPVIEDTKPYSEEEANKAKANNGLVLVSANCNDFAWFKKGAMLEYEMKSTNSRKKQSSKIQVKDVRSEGHKTIADIVATDEEGRAFEMNYLCSGNQLYFDMTDMLKKAMEEQGQNSSKMDVSFDGGLMSIPKNAYPGQKLEDAIFTMNMSNQGMNIVVTSSLKDRKVAGTERVSTPAGSFNCIKLTGVRTIQMKMLGTNRNTGKPVIEEMYFAPAIGVIKTVSKTEKGKVEYEQQLISYNL